MRIIKQDGAHAKEERGTRDGIELSLRPEYYRCDYCGVAMARDGHEKCTTCKQEVEEERFEKLRDMRIGL